MRSQKALLRQWEELPLTESVNLSVGVFGQPFLTDEPQRLMQAFWTGSEIPKGTPPPARGSSNSFQHRPSCEALS